MNRFAFASLVFSAAGFLAARSHAADYHVAVTGDDAAAGSSEAPWRTIQKAADTMQPGDTCIVHAGTYREYVNPARGGTAAAPITYQGADGEAVYIKGSEQLATWTQDAGDVWKVVVPNTTFGTFNPYAANFSGDYLTAGMDYHLGNVYLNGTPYSEVLTQAGVSAAPETWYSQVAADSTTIWANFDGANPNDGLAEINVRKYAIFPSTLGLDHIAIRGFNIMQGATNFAPPTAYPQEGLVGSNWGMAWTIENNHITDGKTVCFSGGLGSRDASESITESGNHIIRHNTIERCGEAGIAGSHGMVASVIEGNLIQDIMTPTTHFAGFECAGIKIHSAIDVVIKDNIIRRVGAGAVGIWLDWQAQGSRLTGNVIYGLASDIMTLEVNHGPTLIDNNVFVGGNLADSSEGTVFVHNLFSTTGFAVGLTDGRTPGYFTPHTTEEAGTAMHNSVDNKYFNNVFANANSGAVPQQPGFESDRNVYYGSGSSDTTWGDGASVTHASVDGTVEVSTLPDGVTVSFNGDSAARDVQCALITRDLIGELGLAMQGIENHDGSAITVDHDITGAARDATHPTAGPLEALSDTNTITIHAGATLVGTTGGSGGSGTGGGTSTGGAGGGAGTSPAGGDTSGGTNSGGGDSGAGGLGGGGVGGSAGTSEGGSGAGTAGSSSEASGSGDDSGCGCRVPGRPSSRAVVAISALALGAMLARRRRRLLGH